LSLSRRTNPRGALSIFGRWHHKGQPILYCTSSLALAVLEQRVNGAPFLDIREDFHYANIDLKGVRVEDVPDERFQAGWMEDLRGTQDFGTAWSRSLRSAVLQVRSAVLPVEWNYLINTAHPDFAKVSFSEPKPIPLDERV
jgi:RES domain-containing protein